MTTIVRLTTPIVVKGALIEAVALRPLTIADLRSAKRRPSKAQRGFRAVMAATGLPFNAIMKISDVDLRAIDATMTGDDGLLKMES